ncbi:MAG: tryptophan synthase subunit alpha [Candidatus Poribacteria bacterium]
MNRIEKKFKELKSTGKKAFIPFITAGDPTLDITMSLILKLESVGADIIELGIPFSDPIADGPSIQRASLRALENNTSIRDVIRLVSEVREKTDIPIVVMGYYNPIYKYGVKKFTKVAVEAGIDGVIIADLPPEEASDLIEQARQNGLSTIFLIAPTSTAERIKLISDSSTGYIYCVSTTGVTGIRDKISDALAPTINSIRQFTDKPIAVGFGVSTPDQAYEVAKLADGVIVGSAIVNVIEKYKDSPDEIVEYVGYFTSKLAEAIKR